MEWVVIGLGCYEEPDKLEMKSCRNYLEPQTRNYLDEFFVFDYWELTFIFGIRWLRVHELSEYSYIGLGDILVFQQKVYDLITTEVHSYI